MTPWKPPPPVPRKRPFQLFSGSHTSILICESMVGASVAVTRQNGGRPVIGAEPGGVKVPPVMSVAEVMVVCSSAREDCRLVHGLAIADVLPSVVAAIANVASANRPVALPARQGRSMVVLPFRYARSF